MLEEIARNPDAYPSARVSAIRLLQELAPPEVDSQFDDLYEFRQRRSGDRVRPAEEGRRGRAEARRRHPPPPGRHRAGDRARRAAGAPGLVIARGESPSAPRTSGRS
jgi:hypothetical protein